MLDLDAVEERLLQQHRDSAFDPCHLCGMGLSLLAALRAVLETTPEELAEAMVWPWVSPEATLRLAHLGLAYLKNKAGGTL